MPSRNVTNKQGWVRGLTLALTTKPTTAGSPLEPQTYQVLAKACRTGRALTSARNPETRDHPATAQRCAPFPTRAVFDVDGQALFASDHQSLNPSCGDRIGTAQGRAEIE